MKRNRLGLILGLAITILALGCQKDDEPVAQTKNNISNDVSEKIKSLGFDPKSVVEYDDYYLVEGDISLRKDALDSYFEKNTTLKQARTSNLVSADNVSNITVYIHSSMPTSGDDNWRPAIQSAISKWNATQSNVNITLSQNSNADIVIRSDGGTQEDETIAIAEFPSYGSPGYRIRVNLDAVNNKVFSSAQKILTMVHEIGHTLGFRHTNWYGNDEPYGIGIPGTPNTGLNPDPNSVMNAVITAAGWIGFSNYDLIAIRKLYPLSE